MNRFRSDTPRISCTFSERKAASPGPAGCREALTWKNDFQVPIHFAGVITAVFVLLFISQAVIQACPIVKSLKANPNPICINGASKIVSAVDWDDYTSENKFIWKATGPDFDKSIVNTSNSIIFPTGFDKSAKDIKPGVYTITLDVKGTNKKGEEAYAHSKQSAEQRSVKIAVVELINVKLVSGPDWAPVGKNVGGKEFEIEVYEENGYKDKISLKAITNPSDTGGSAIRWEGPKVSGTGLIKKDIYYRTHGTKTITVSCGNKKIKVTVHVNHNTNSPISSLSIKITPSEGWAHVGKTIKKSETLTLEAHAVDNDFIKGKKAKDNFFDRYGTEWFQESGILDKEMNDVVKWTPTEIGETTVTATFHDATDTGYYPRNDDDRNPPPQKQVHPGGFKVGVSLTVTGSKGASHFSEVDEDGNKKGDKIPAVFKKPLDMGYRVTKPCDDGGEQNLDLTWNFITYPSNAILRGVIIAKLSTMLIGTMEAECKDESFPTDDKASEISWSVTINPAPGIGFGITVPITFYDSSESAAALTYGFSSSDMPDKNPKMVKLDLESKSFLRNYDKKFMSYYSPPDMTVIKRKDKESKARFQSFIYVKSNNSNASALGNIIGSLIIASYRDVKYKVAD